MPRRSARLPAAPMAQPDPPLKAAAAAVRILGLDPGSRATGYGLIECRGTASTYLASGAIHTEGESFPARLEEIFAAVSRLAAEFQPDEVAIERVFMHRNPDSALKLGQARGAALCGVFARKPAIHEYAPREIKLAVVGTGAAQKEQVQLMVVRLLRLTGVPGADAADALAVALCHAQARRLGPLLPGRTVRRRSAG